jgi:glycosyltransferase involved in cell wall biosynthesis
MNVLVLAPYRYDTAPCQRYRIEQWMPHLAKAGVHFEFDPFMSAAFQQILYQPGHLLPKLSLAIRDYLRRLRLGLRPGRYDAIFLHREASIIGPAWLERLFARSGVPIVYEFDDAIYVPYVSPSNRYLSYLKCHAKTATICRLSRHVIVGNQTLRDYATQWNPNVTVVPSTIDAETYRPRQSYALTGEAVLGWTGSHSAMQYLDIIKPALRELARRHPFRLEIVGTHPFEIEGVKTAFRPWRAASEVEDLSALHVGLMPVPDEAWAKGKCALKALQYMALGVPAVVSPVGANRVVVQDGVNGFHAGTTEEWVERLSQLIQDAALRERLGREARRTVEVEYSAQAQAPRVLSVLQSVARA